jgi:hypothetical protein
MNSSDSIQMKHDGSQPEQLHQIVVGLQEDGYSGAVFTEFSEIDAAQPRPITQLLLISVAPNEVAQLLEAIKSRGDEDDAPVLVTLSQSLPDDWQTVSSEIEISL